MPEPNSYVKTEFNYSLWSVTISNLSALQEQLNQKFKLTFYVKSNKVHKVQINIL